MVFARLVRCLLGVSAIADKKLEFGVPLTVLGIAIHVSDEGLHLVPEPEKVSKWTAQVPVLCASLPRLMRCIALRLSLLFRTTNYARVKLLNSQARSL